MEKTKRILLIVTQAEGGGVQGYVVRCAQEAQQQGYAVLVAAGGNGPLETRCAEVGVPYRRLQHMTRSLALMHDVAATRELIALMRDWKPSTAFLHSSKAGLLGSIAAKIARVPRVVYRIGGWSFLDPVSPLQQQLRLWSEKSTARLKDVIITVHPGDEARAKVHGIHPREQLVTIPNGVDLTALDTARQPHDVARQHLTSAFSNPCPPDAQLLLSIAHFYPTKDLIGYLHALAIVTNTIPTLRAVIIGDGEQRAELEALQQKLGLKNNVALPGAQPNASALLSGADLFVLPSAKEGMPWTVLEAMAACVPIVTTDVGSNRWVLGDAAWIVPPKNPQALADALIAALQHPREAARHATAARTALESRFTAQTMWQQTFPLLG